jgi:hypothetical protein
VSLCGILGVGNPHDSPGGMLGGGNIVIKFDSASTAWSDHVYMNFVNWLKEHVRRERLTCDFYFFVPLIYLTQSVAEAQKEKGNGRRRVE